MAEKAWSKLALHFALSLGEKDTKILIELQKIIELWKDNLFTVRTDIFAKENQMKNHFFSYQKASQSLITEVK